MEGRQSCSQHPPRRGGSFLPLLMIVLLFGVMYFM